MPLIKCPKCGEKYDPVYFKHECQEQKREKQLGFGWGYGWIGLSIFTGFMATIGVVIFLIFLLDIELPELPFVSAWIEMLVPLGFLLYYSLFFLYSSILLPFILLALLGVLIGFSIAQIIGLLQQKKWGLYLVYVVLGVVLGLGALGSVINLIKRPELFISIIFGLGLKLVIIYLWFSYFYRRRAWFNAGKEKIPSPLPGTFPSSWDIKDTLIVIFLVLLLPIGLMLMWAVEKWSKRARVIITIVSLSSFIVVNIYAFWVTLTFSRAFFYKQFNTINLRY